MSEELEFRISSGLKDIIGKDLITDDFIAVFELVKNSYDAFAKNVVITIENDKIIIADNGKGMSLQDLKNKWLFVAYSAKKDGTEDDKKSSYRDKIQERRHYAGAKGIGRFSSDRLGKYLSIITRKEGTEKIERIDVDWSKFEKDQTNEFETIKVTHNTSELQKNIFPKNKNNGTILEISGLQNDWGRVRLQRLKHSLEKLINPFSNKSDFDIDIICEREVKEDDIGIYTKGPNKGKKYSSRDKINGSVKNAILDILELKTSQISLYIVDDFIETKIIDRSKLIYHIKEKSKEFSITEDLKIDLFYLNRSAKRNFTTKMGVQPINFGSIFLFKNGFRVQPFGEKGDDSWGIDYRAQQGYNRFLGTRDLFGRVEITSDNSEQFKEVSNREGGLVKTKGFTEIVRAFNLAHRRLERYVVGVLWGEGFIRKKYFGDGDEAVDKAQKYREILSEDKDTDNINIVSSNLGSKLDFIQIIKSLASDKEIEIIDYNKDFINLINENIDENQTKFISDLEKIAEKTNDEKLKKQILRTEEQYQALKKEKEEAEIKAREEEQKRIEAEEIKRIALFELEKAQIKAQEEVVRRRKEEEKRKEAEDKKRIAEIETLKKENERLKAETRAKEAEKKTKITEDQNKYLLATSNTSQEVKDLVHTISINSTDINGIINSIYDIIKDEKINSHKLMKELDALRFSSEKIKLFGDIITKANFNTLKEKNIIDIPVFIKEYISAYSQGSKMKFKFKTIVNKFKTMINLLDIYIIFDNLISNSKKSGAKKIVIDMSLLEEKLIIDFSDNGDGVSQKYIQNPEDIFSIGVTDKKGGSGIGLYTIKTKMKDDLHGDIVFVDNGIEFKKGATFRLIFGR